MKIVFFSQWKFEQLAERLSLLLVGRKEVFTDERREDKFQIGDGNNWWLFRLDSDPKRPTIFKYKLQHRYGSEDLMKSYAVVLEHLGIISSLSQE